MKNARQKYRAGKGFCFFNCLLDGMHTNFKGFRDSYLTFLDINTTHSKCSVNGKLSIGTIRSQW